MLALSGAEWYLLFVLVTAVGLILSNRAPPDLVAILILLALSLGGLLTVEQAISGFSSPAVVTIIGLFVITAALERTGIILILSEWLAQLSGHTEARLVTVALGAGALLSLVVNNIAAGAVLLPATLRVAKKAGVPASKALLPLAYGTTLGGMATLFTTANILMSALLQDQGYRALTMADFLVTGGPVALAGIVYMVLFGRHQLPTRKDLTPLPQELEDVQLSETYQLDERLWEAYVLDDSPLVGKSLAESQIGSLLGVTVLAMLRAQTIRAAVTADDTIQAYDRLLIVGREERVRQLESRAVQVNPASQHVQELPSATAATYEIIIAPRSPAIGQTLIDLQLRSRFDVTAIALWRERRSYRTDISRIPLQAGDALFVVGAEKSVQALAQQPGYIVPQIDQVRPATAQQRFWAVTLSAIAIGLSVFNLVATPIAMLAGAIGLVIAGCLRMRDVYTAVEWRIIFLVAGMTPISIALQQTGLAQKFGDLCVLLFAPFGSLGLIGGFYLLSFLVVQAIGGQVTSLVVGPLAIAAAVQASVDPVVMGVVVAVASSAAFLTPVAHPVNLLMMNPGGYVARDFIRVGLGTSVVCFVALLVTVALVWPL